MGKELSKEEQTLIQLKATQLQLRGTEINADGNYIQAMGSVISGIGAAISSYGSGLSAQGSSTQGLGAHLNHIGDLIVFKSHILKMQQLLDQLQDYNQSMEVELYQDCVKKTKADIKYLYMQVESLLRQVDEMLKVLGKY